MYTSSPLSSQYLRLPSGSELPSDAAPASSANARNRLNGLEGGETALTVIDTEIDAWPDAPKGPEANMAPSDSDTAGVSASRVAGNVSGSE